MNNTIFEFWKMISEHNCQIIVSLNQDYIKEDPKSLYFPLDNQTKIIEVDDLKFSISIQKSPYENDLDSNNSGKIIEKEYEVIEIKVCVEDGLKEFLFYFYF
jgi:hypothetical protein